MLLEHDPNIKGMGRGIVASEQVIQSIVIAGVQVELTEATYQGEEGDPIRVCAKLVGENGNCIVPFDFLVIFSTTDGTGSKRGKTVYKTCQLHATDTGHFPIF